MHWQPRLYFFILFFLYTSWFVSAQGGHPIFRHYTTIDGLPSSECYDLLQDRQGYIWISTDNGVSRFNGYHFENFGPEQGLLNNVVFNMQEDEKGRIWFSTLSRNMYYYSYKDNTIRTYEHNSILQQYNTRYRVLSGFAVAPKGKVYAELYGLGIIEISSDGRHEIFGANLPCSRFIYQPEGVPIQASKSNCTIDQLKPIKDSTSFDLYWKSNQGEKLIRIKGPSLVGTYSEAFQSKEEVFLFLDNYLYYFKDEAFRFARPVPYFVNCIYQPAGESIFYLGFNEKEGFAIYNNSGDLLADKRVGHYLKGYSISHILKDRTGGLWVSTLENGIFYAPDPQFLSYDMSSGLSNNNVTAVSLDASDRVYLGLKNGDVYALQSKKRSLYKYPKLPTDNEIYTLHYHITNKILFKAALQFDFLDGEKWKSIPINRLDGRKEYSGTRRVAPSRDPNKLWTVLTGSSGFGRINVSDKKFEFETRTMPIQPLRERVYDICEDYNGRVWLGKIDGLFEFQEKDSLLRPERIHPAFAGRVEALKQLKDSSLVIGTKGHGVIIWRKDQLRQIKERDGLTSNMVENLHIDADQNIWIGTLNGLNRLTLSGFEDFSIKTFTSADGLPTNEINMVASHENNIWVATTGGLVKLPAVFSENGTSPAPAIVQVLVNGQAVDLDSLAVLKHHQNHLLINLLTINYRLAGKITYRYRLASQNQWEYSQSPIINLAALSSGDYQLEVQSEDENQRWSASTYLSFHIAKPFWQSSPFLVGISLLLFGLISFFYWNKVQQLKKEAIVQQEEARREQERADLERELKDLEAAAMRAQMNPHFLSNCLNSIQSFIARDDSINAMRYLSDFNQLLRSTLEISQQRLVPLEKDIQHLKRYLQLEQMRFGNRFSYAIEVDEELYGQEVRLPPMLIQPFVENAIMHAFPTNSSNAKINIHYSKQNHCLLACVIDNGIGVSKSVQMKGKNQSHFQKSFGIELPKRRLELIGKTKNQVFIEEIKDNQGFVCGTKAQIMIDLTLPKKGKC